ncbi:MAG: hypothetical protein IKS13_03730 [Ruminococcus sp.]|nr:hypothetical protein [Ruminococcus sp.]
MDILKLIPYGRDNSISTVELANLLGEETRTVRDRISRLRRQGVIICSNSDKSIGQTGYFQPISREELETFVKVESARIRTHREAIAPAQRKLKALERKKVGSI